MKNNSVLFVSDLDGTLMNDNQIISKFTCDTINFIVNTGVNFAFATARSDYSAFPIIKNITTNVPTIVYNGVFIKNKSDGTYLSKTFFSNNDIFFIYDLLTKNNVYPFVYTKNEKEEKFYYYENKISEEQKDFLNTKVGDSRKSPLFDNENIVFENIFYFTCIDKKERLEPMYLLLKDIYTCYFQKDIYSGDWWLEIAPKGTSKAEAVKKLADILECSKIVCFGDGINDISMFEIADECYAVENADLSLKKYANEIILSNNDDGVAKWLLKNIDNYK